MRVVNSRKNLWILYTQILLLQAHNDNNDNNSNSNDNFYNDNDINYYPL